MTLLIPLMTYELVFVLQIGFFTAMGFYYLATGVRIDRRLWKVREP